MYAYHILKNRKTNFVKKKLKMECNVYMWREYINNNHHIYIYMIYASHHLTHTHLFFSNLLRTIYLYEYFVRVRFFNITYL